MPLVGNLSEFPLPEVLLLIGNRTGRLRLFDIPKIVPVEMDLSEGRALALRVGETFVTHPPEMVAELSFLVESGSGMFEFSAQPATPASPEEPLPINELVMRLVLHVDEKLAKQHALLAPQAFYLLEVAPSHGGLSPELNLFFQQSRQLLSGGVRAEDLAEYLGMSEEMIRPYLDDLHQLGFIKRLETSDVETLRAMMVQQEISQKSNEFQLAVEASDLIRRTGRLLKVPINRDTE